MLHQEIGRMEKDVLSRLAKGNEKAFRQVFEEYTPSLIVFARRFVSGEEAHDAVQDVFLQLWNRREDFRDISSVQSYLFLSMKNHCLNLLRREDVRARYLQSLCEEDFEDCMLDVEVYSLLYKAIGNLPGHYRKVISLSLDGYTLEQIADTLGVSKDAVKAYKRRGKELLRKDLQQMYGTALAFVLLGFIG